MQSEFNSRNTKVIELSIDMVEDHQKWIENINETQMTCVRFLIIADHDLAISKLYDFINPKASVTAIVRSLLILDPNKIIRLIITYQASTVRNFDEIIRILDSLQLVDRYTIAIPVNWKDGDDVIIPPSISTEDVPKLYPKGVREIKSYLRYTPHPDKE